MLEESDFLEHVTFISRWVCVHVHQGAHSEDVPAHSHHGGEQTLEVLERVLEQRANASAPTSVWSQETGKKEDWGVVVDVISHLRNKKEEREVWFGGNSAGTFFNQGLLCVLHRDCQEST